MGTYAVERVMTSNMGTVIRMRQTGTKDPKKPELITIYDKDNNGIDRGDIVLSGYDFAYQQKAAYRKIVQTRKLPRTINGERVVGSVLDGGITTRRKVKRSDIARWKAKVNPILSRARRHRRVIKARTIRVHNGRCIEKAPPKSWTESVEVRAVFKPPLTLATLRPRKWRMFRSLSFAGNAKAPRKPSQCMWATGKANVRLGRTTVRATVSTRLSLFALYTRNAIPRFIEGQRANISYMWTNWIRYTHINLK